MKFGELLEIAAREPAFPTGFLLAGRTDAADVRRQLSRWTKRGVVLQLRRGLYALAPPFRRVEPHPFWLANRLRAGSYVSLESALDFHGLIPEAVPAVTSVTPGRPGTAATPLGRFIYRHLKRAGAEGFVPVEVAPGQTAFVARPEKALLDLVRLVPGAEDEGYLRELRLRPDGRLDPAAVETLAAASGSPKLRRAAKVLARILEEEKAERTERL